MPGTREKEREPVTARPADGTALANGIALAVFQHSYPLSLRVFARNPPSPPPPRRAAPSKPAITISTPLSDEHGSETRVSQFFTVASWECNSISYLCSDHAAKLSLFNAAFFFFYSRFQMEGNSGDLSEMYRKLF